MHFDFVVQTNCAHRAHSVKWYCRKLKRETIRLDERKRKEEKERTRTAITAKTDNNENA